MRNFLLMICVGTFSFVLTGCGSEKPTAIEIPESNPYQQTPEEIAKYNAEGAAKSQANKGAP